MNRRNRNGLLIPFICSLAFVASIAITVAESAAAVGCDVYASTCGVESGGVEVGLTRKGLDGTRHGLDIKTGAADVRSFEYDTVYACQFNTAGARARNDADVLCAGAIRACAGNTPAQGQGPQARLYRRELNASGNPVTGWTFIGTTCSPELVPGKPVLGLGPVLAAFHNTAFAKPAVHIQPEHNVTLVTLPTYFEVKWPAAGFQPGEIDTTTMLGRQVRIRPTLSGYTYVFGDDTTFGPTPSPGGIYPDGDITHAYPTRGVYPTRIDITYGGEFSVNGGAWVPIPDTVTIAGPVQPLTVKTAHAQLVNP